MNNKTPSQLADFSGDKNMYLHAQKPGKSERISIDYLTKDSVQIGDVVTRRTGNYEGYIETGGFYDANEYPELASKLVDPNFGAYIGAINLNSEIRFGANIYTKVLKMGQYVVAQNASATHLYNLNNIGNPSNYGANAKIFKSLNRMYMSAGSLFFAEGGLTFNTGTPGVMVGIGAKSGSDVLFYVNGNNLLAYIYSGHGQPVPAGSIVFDSNRPIQTLYVSIKNIACMSVGGVYGIYELSISESNTLSATLLVETQEERIYGDSGPEFYSYTDYAVTARNAFDFESAWELMIPHGVVIKNFVSRQGVQIIVQQSNLPTLISFDFGMTWAEAPAMSGYLDADFDEMTKSFVFVGGSGSTGSSNGSSGSIQVNYADYVINGYFSIPLIDSGSAGLTTYMRAK